ncbi:hypothetical protein FN846DRAFT_956844 [Sphaerosporella brunnea]|uniref:Spo12 family-domain-containing protein n=1 Tax=Sphaerosporella brunnea TaxID=1250544 RepID=A0A5J5ESI5_9PEZI|nr:hypothetical protein FN846DRAFT_956844 [Sphaerosporella brunnea]
MNSAPSSSAAPNPFAEPSTPANLESSPAVQELEMNASEPSSSSSNISGSGSSGSGSMSTLEKQRQLLQQKLAQPPIEFSSPTDQMMTPVSRKLADQKKKVFSRAKPGSLASRLKALGAEKKPPLRPAATRSKSSLGVFGEPSSSSPQK